MANMQPHLGWQSQLWAHLQASLGCLRQHHPGFLLAHQSRQYAAPAEQAAADLLAQQKQQPSEDEDIKLMQGDCDVIVCTHMMLLHTHTHTYTCPTPVQCFFAHT